MLKGSPREDVIATIVAAAAESPSHAGQLKNTAMREVRQVIDDDESPLTQRETQVLRHVAWGLAIANCKSLEIASRRSRTRAEHPAELPSASHPGGRVGHAQGLRLSHGAVQKACGTAASAVPHNASFAEACRSTTTTWPWPFCFPKCVSRIVVELNLKAQNTRLQCPKIPLLLGFSFPNFF